MNYHPRNLIIIAIACSFAAGSLARAGALNSTSSMSPSETAAVNNARLSVRRSADFGTDIYLVLFIDGIHVATLGQNEGYEATVRPGRHVLSAKTTPNPYGNTVSTSSDVTMKGGKSYSFTAVWGETDRATLDNSNATVVRLIRNISHY